MNRLVMIGRAGISSLLTAAVFLTAGNTLIGPAEAQGVAQPQLSYTCQFSDGPRAGQIQTYTGVAGPPIPIGVECADGQGSTGVVIPEPSVQPLRPAQPPPAPPAPATTFICRFDNGPRAGETQSYAGVTGMQPIPVGAQCTDGRGSTGVAIAAAPAAPVQPPPAPPAPATTFACQFNDGPRAGQVQSYAGVTGIQPMAVGAPCTDGQGSSGVAVPEPAVQPPAPSVPPPPAVQPPAPSIPSPATSEPAPPPSVPPPPAFEAPPAPPPFAPSVQSLGPAHARSTRAGAVAPSVITGAAVGAPIRGLRGAVWADPDNIGYVTGYTYKGRYHRGTPARYDPTARAVLSAAVRRQAPAAPTDVVPPFVRMAGTAVNGLPGAIWVDVNNDGVVDGYVANGQYSPGVPPGYRGSAAPPPSPPPPPPAGPPVVPSLAQSGERG